ncbi:hypothetical protein SDC9_205328 [bioreactor metagenome]|uniref:Uncharacterized protein n=1 Tax=bioreactor metagenome TaxID=1076179 RepID=A0A645JB06_9ZZZZ
MCGYFTAGDSGAACRVHACGHDVQRFYPDADAAGHGAEYSGAHAGGRNARAGINGCANTDSRGFAYARADGNARAGRADELRPLAAAVAVAVCAERAV